MHEIILQRGWPNLSLNAYPCFDRGQIMPVLITQAELENLPAEPRERFVELEEICRNRMHELTSGDEISWTFVQDIRLQYMSTVVAAAKFYKIEPISHFSVPKRSRWDDGKYDDFVNEVHFYTIQLALEAADRNFTLTVILVGPVRDRLSTLLEHLREQVEKLDLPPARIAYLLARLDDFERAIQKPRLTFSAVAALTVLVTAGVADVGGAAQTIRGVLNLIEETVGTAKEEQDRKHAARLAPAEQRMLEAPRNPSEELSPHEETLDIDDEIPF